VAFRIASHVAFRWLKQRKRWQAVGVDEVALEGIPKEDQRLDELLRELRVTEGVSPASRAVLVLHFQEDLPLSEVAAILAIPLGTVKSRLAYGLATLRRHLSSLRRI
jgi:RNA polymerase sigma-70 factor, ECF subfamily